MVIARVIAVVAAVGSLVCAQSVAAFDWTVEAHVIRIASTAFPDQIEFMIDTAIGSCPAGNWLTYVPSGSTDARQIASAQWAASQLLTARAGNLKIALFGDNAGCRVEHIHTI